MNDAPGSARVFARTLRDVIDWRGQRRTFFQGAHELVELPPIAVCWGDRDTTIPAAHGRAFSEFVEGVVLRQFEGCGHYLHNEQPSAFARTLLDFLDDAAVPSARIRQTEVLPITARTRLGWMGSWGTGTERFRASGMTAVDSCLGHWRRGAPPAKAAGLSVVEATGSMTWAIVPR